jgi:superfamily II DNA or RNA helicase
VGIFGANQAGTPRALRRGVRLLRPGDVVRIRDQRWSVVRHVPGSSGSLLDVRGRDRSNHLVFASFLLPCEPCERLPRSATARIVRSRTWWRRLRIAVAEATPAPDAMRTLPSATLAVLPFQLEPALAVVRGMSSRILIADEVGLGKTVQAGLVISEVLRRSPAAHVLVVTPAGLRGQWRDELRDRFALDGCVIDSPTLARQTWPSTGNPWAAHPIVITSLDFVKRAEVLRALEALIWDVVVFDEAHAIAGRSNRATAARGLADRARTVLLLTATPHSGDDEAFARLCATGDLRREFPLLVFRRSRRDVGLATQRRTTWLRVRPTLAEAAMHRAALAYARRICAQRGVGSAGARFVASILGRRACSSAASLARSVERRLALLASADGDTAQPLLPFDDTDLTDEAPDAVLATPGLHDRSQERRTLERLLDLARRAAQHESKILAIGRFLRRAHQPAIVFTEYRDTLATVAAAVSMHDPVLLHGGLTASERHESALAFNSGRSPLLLATDAASEGLNLHHRCRLVINLELPWTPVRLEQRIGRIDRIGQTRRVHAVHLVASGTTEDDSVARLMVKTAHIESAVEAVQPDADGVERVSMRADLRSIAVVEAARLTMARRLTEARLADTTYETRPCIALAKRREHRRSIWIYRLAILDEEQQVVWDTLLGITGTLGVESRRAAALRALASSSHDMLAAVISQEHQGVIASAMHSMREPLMLAGRRERAIVDSLTTHRARLAAALLQRGLFDRRDERAAAAQAAVVDEALGRCVLHIAQLGRLERVAAEPVELRFTLLAR